MKNISQATDEDKAIQASIQESIKELMGGGAPAETPAETPTIAPQDAVPEPIQEPIPEPIQELAQEPEVPQDTVEESPEESTEESTENLIQDSTLEPTEDLTEELLDDIVLEPVPESIQESEQGASDDDTEDILFEEVLDLDSIQQKLLDRIYEDDDEIQASQDVDSIIDKKAAILEEKRAKLPVKVNNLTAKKYVIYVDSGNIDFMENLSVNERKEIINKILQEQNTLSIKTKELNEKRKYLQHAIVACFTFIICFPIMFIIVNKSIEASMTNYQQAKQNVMKLYKKQGKIQMNDPEAVKNIKY